jgi:hypothetical protein
LPPSSRPAAHTLETKVSPLHSSSRTWQERGQPAALFQPDLAGTLPGREHAAVFPTAPENVTGYRGRAHLHRAEARAPIAVKTVARDIPGITGPQIETITPVPFHTIGGEHDRRADRIAGKTVASVSGQLVVRHKPVPTRDLDAAPFVPLHDAMPDDEEPNPQQVNSMP